MTAEQIVAMLRGRVLTEGDPAKREAFIEAHNDALRILRGEEQSDEAMFAAYLVAVTSDPKVFVEAFRFDEWIANGKPKGGQ